jgi:hypothetical protein
MFPGFSVFFWSASQCSKSEIKVTIRLEGFMLFVNYQHCFLVKASYAWNAELALYNA